MASTYASICPGLLGNSLVCVDSIIGCRRGLLHALGALAERDEYTLDLLIRAQLRACLWHLPWS